MTRRYCVTIVVPHQRKRQALDPAIRNWLFCLTTGGELRLRKVRDMLQQVIRGDIGRVVS